MSRGSKAASRPPRTSSWLSGNGCARSSRRARCSQSACGRSTRIGPRSVVTAEDPTRLGRELRRRYTAADLGVLTPDELSRLAPDGEGDPQADATLAWELLFRLEPEL